MKPTEEELEKIRVCATIEHELDKYVWLREDDKGRYIEYAFKEGAPHDNRCLSWYFSFQPGAIKRNGESFGDTPESIQKFLDLKKKQLDSKVDNLYVLQSFTCGYEENPQRRLEEAKEDWPKYSDGEPFIEEEHICKVGCPAPRCVRNKICSHWTYEEPVKCACWTLREPTVPRRVLVPIELVMKLKKELCDTLQ